MIQPSLNQSDLKSLMDYDPETGSFTQKTKRPGVKQGAIAGSLMLNGYIQIRVLGRKYLAHRLAFLYMMGEMPSECVDHIDGNPSNNTWSNLRLASHAQNMRNRKAVSGYKGVSAHRGNFRAVITAKGVRYNLGSFLTADLAAQAYDRAAIKLHGSFARVNKLSEVAA
ncbi:AP2/ERF family transcription factor [Oceanospirillum sanctuarii]|uniref:AP2/ERF family transcription factor n=1 Tax=Oceanospirillum sanctuarii TaxID=1434821 RepID=UPI000A35F9CA|nr:AP2/ERF family transcription factor [Oceanospirillum sanctuarii]